MSTMTPEAIREAGLKALQRDLGVAGMARFIQQFELGKGNYTTDRWRWLTEDVGVESLSAEIKGGAKGRSE